MPNWKFWGKPTVQPAAKAEAPEPVRRFSAKPRTDLPGINSHQNKETSDALSRLRKRREAVLFDVEQAYLAAQPENPWHERVALLDEAIAAVRAERERQQSETEPPGIEVAAIPITSISFKEGPPPAVEFDLLGEHFVYAEDLDWAERGFQIARSDMHLVAGDLSKLSGAIGDGPQHDELLSHLDSSLFVFTSDVRDRVLAGDSIPVNVTLLDLARPDSVVGGWLDWKGHSPAAARREQKLSASRQEEERLLAERDRELQERARWEDRLPIAKRRLADVDAEIAALGV